MSRVETEMRERIVRLETGKRKPGLYFHSFYIVGTTFVIARLLLNVLSLFNHLEYISISHSLSLYMYIYISMYVCMYI